MFDLSWSELLVLAIVTLLLVGPKDLPAFLRTLGRYTGVVKRHAAEFRAHFDAAMREAELDALKKDVEELGRQTSGALDETLRALPTAGDLDPREGPASRPPSTPLAAPAASNENSPVEDNAAASASGPPGQAAGSSPGALGKA